MTDLSHWDFSEVFTGLEAAALMIGLDPASDKLEKTRPVVARMELSYAKTLFAHKLNLWSPALADAGIGYIEVKNEDDPFSLGNLHSWRMASFYEESFFEDYANKTQRGLAELSTERFNLWLVDENRNGFDHQLFLRYDLHTWLEELRLTSKYEFMGPSAQADSEPQTIGVRHNSLERRDLLTPVIELAQSQCRNSSDASEVWAKLRSLAQEKSPPLIGSDESGIQYLDANEQFKTLNLKAMRMRLRRAR